MSEWISVETELPPQNWPVIVRNGKQILPHVTYRYKKWHYWDRKLHCVTHWKFDENCKPSIPEKDMRAYLKRVKTYKHQMQPLKFKTGPVVF